MKKVMKSVLVIFLCTVLVLNTAGWTSSSTKLAAKKQVTLNALFMKQAGYSQQDVEAITNAFMKANPSIKVNLTFVAYEVLGPKILASASTGGYDVVLGDCIWPAQFAQAGLVKDLTSRVSKLDLKDIFEQAH